MGDLASAFTHALTQAGVRLGTTPLVLMVSGGSDSTALAYLTANALAACNEPSDTDCNGRDSHGSSIERDIPAACTMPATSPAVGILHVNHELRGEAADADERFVEELAEQLGFSFYCYHADVAAMAHEEGGNVEAIGRRERYAAAYEVLADLQAQIDAHAIERPAANKEAGCGVSSPAAPQSAYGFILTAHTQDDRVENFYMRSIVGTGPGGFRGMTRQNGCVLHPLLDCSREDLRAYIMQHADMSDTVARTPTGALWCEDATNYETDRFRTFVRHEIVPHAKEQNTRLLDTLSRSMDLIADEDDYLEACARKLMLAHIGWINPLGPDWFTQRMGGILPDTNLSVVVEDEHPEPDYSAGCILGPQFANEPLVLKRRVIFHVLQLVLGEDARVETASVEAILSTLGKSGAVVNIQGNLAVSTNKRGTRIEPMEAYRTRRKR